MSVNGIDCGGYANFNMVENLVHECNPIGDYEIRSMHTMHYTGPALRTNDCFTASRCRL